MTWMFFLKLYINIIYYLEVNAVWNYKAHSQNTYVYKFKLQKFKLILNIYQKLQMPGGIFNLL